MEERYCLRKDDDAHWYLITVNQCESFDEWLAAAPYWEGYEGHDFNENRIDGYHSVTFSDPRQVNH